MKIRIGSLRSLIKEELSARTRDDIHDVLRHTIDVAKKFVHSVVTGKRDKQAAKELEMIVTKRVSSAAKFVLNHKDESTDIINTFARAAAELVKKSGFLQTPMFFRKGEHMQVLQDLLDEMKDALAKFEGNHTHVNVKHSGMFKIPRKNSNSHHPMSRSA